MIYGAAISPAFTGSPVSTSEISGEKTVICSSILSIESFRACTNNLRIVLAHDCFQRDFSVSHRSLQYFNILEKHWHSRPR